MKEISLILLSIISILAIVGLAVLFTEVNTTGDATLSRGVPVGRMYSYQETWGKPEHQVVEKYRVS